MSRKTSIDQFLSETRIALTNAGNDAEVQAELARFGYDAARLAEGRALLDAATRLHGSQQAEYGEQIAATTAFQDAFEAARAAYVRHLTLARVAFKDDAGAAVALKLGGRRKRSYSGLLDQARQFYDNVLASEARTAAMAAYGQTEEVLGEARALVLAAIDANAAQEHEKGDAQRTTQERDAAFDALGDWMSDFIAVARVAFTDDGQQLEKLGIVVRA